jgi:hypothetical protein
MNEINYIDEGLTPPSDLINMLKFKYAFSDEELNSISEVENHKGNWIITFEKSPSLRLVLIIVAIFEDELSYDGIDAIIFEDTRYENLAGTLRDGGKGLVSLLSAIELAEKAQ